jgi:hypothetical protein
MASTFNAGEKFLP